ncbi:MAG TPA: NADP-dependent isocitrate dehydrogenase [Blastocatellia bacterium]|nr:NADP-dependent isocitrate dehydrogenase [Blastocatellia bacterium]HMV83514.1 NADP-dependent isocitrate dehydrogenase [Blastocatellia bacterium]HMX29421.1 NADP-dependent isocitrate dehydrogenase [Blastocatellia bacterium]HMY71368.1 NADP-dependent isocitrate dehydrogenase [Blastocatellia bacterium]HMZ21807.1 NADP-dependent isocitrate dehydrogenase [Blastocatellia bacterium]
MEKKTAITVAHGDGIGPEIMEATLFILKSAGAALDIETIEIGEKVYKAGYTSGIRPEAWESLRRTKVFLKAPITTPQGGGMKSLNVTIRKTLGLYANIRPCRAYAPIVRTNYPNMDLVIIRENEEDLYAGIEHQQTEEVVQCLKLISVPGCRKIVRYAFEYARARGRKKITCLTKDNIMKLTDGLFHKVFDEIAADYPEIAAEHLIVDIGMARIAAAPERFDVVLAPNLYGDIVSDVAAEVSGSVGLAGSANIGDHGAMFEAVHGSAPDIAGKNIANPSGLLLSAVKMLAHIGQGATASAIHNAWLCTIEDGIHTADIYTEQQSKQKAGTREFAEAVVARLGNKPKHFAPAFYQAEALHLPVYERKAPAKKETVGVDVFLNWRGRQVEELAAQLQTAATADLKLSMITNRGVKVWPEGFPETFCTDHWRCRFQPEVAGVVTQEQIVTLLGRVAQAGMDFIKLETLCTFDGRPAFSLGQGQ